jgi:hypothetical protein
MYLILYNPGTLYLNASYVPYNAPGGYIIMVEERGEEWVREREREGERYGVEKISHCWHRIYMYSNSPMEAPIAPPTAAPVITLLAH